MTEGDIKEAEMERKAEGVAGEEKFERGDSRNADDKENRIKGDEWHGKARSFYGEPGIICSDSR